MTTIPFSIARVNRLRRAAIKAREIPDKDSELSDDGNWSFAHEQANDLLGVFDTLWLKPGFVLHAYVYREFHGGNGWIWAVPADSVPVASRQDPTLQHGRTMRPPEAIPLMQAIEGDGSPWSYLSASILSREAAEFGAFWHGCEWSVHTILSKPPRQADDLDDPTSEREETEDAPVGNWTWAGPVPEIWEPTFVEAGRTRRIVMHVHDPVVGENVYRATDTYRTGSYVATTETEVLCWGEGGFVF